MVVKVQKALRLCNIDAEAALSMSEQELRGLPTPGQSKLALIVESPRFVRY